MRKAFHEPKPGIYPCIVKSKEAEEKVAFEHSAAVVNKMSPDRSVGYSMNLSSSRRKRILVAYVGSSCSVSAPGLWCAFSPYPLEELPKKNKAKDVHWMAKMPVAHPAAFDLPVLDRCAEPELEQEVSRI